MIHQYYIILSDKKSNKFFINFEYYSINKNLLFFFITNGVYTTKMGSNLFENKTINFN